MPFVRRPAPQDPLEAVAADPMAGEVLQTPPGNGRKLDLSQVSLCAFPRWHEQLQPATARVTGFLVRSADQMQRCGAILENKCGW